MENKTISRQFYEHYNGEQPVKTLRDEFAMAYINGVVSRMNPCGEFTFVAEHGYKMADAMMKAREK